RVRARIAVFAFNLEAARQPNSDQSSRLRCLPPRNRTRAACGTRSPACRHSSGVDLAAGYGLRPVHRDVAVPMNLAAPRLDVLHGEAVLSQHFVDDDMTAVVGLGTNGHLE